MKIFLVSLFSLALISTSISQSTNYVEVVVSQSVTLEASEFIYTIKNRSQYSDLEEMMMEMEAYEEYEEVPEEYEREPEEEVEAEVEPIPVLSHGEVMAILDKKNIRYTHRILYNGDEEEDRQWEITATLSSLEEFWDISKRIGNGHGVYMKLTDLKYESIDRHCEEVYPSLLKRAKKRADLLAKGAGKKVGTVIQVSEGVEVVSGVQEWSEYTAAVIASIVDRDKSDPSLTRNAVLSLRYRFELL